MPGRYLFGLQVRSDLPLPAAPASASRNGTLAASLRRVDRAALLRAWPSRGSATLLERRTPRGRLVMTVESHPEAGYRVSAPGYGMHLVTPAGTAISSSLPDVPDWRWQRLLFAQVLPLAATLQGLALFHASAVALEGSAYAFVAASGTGKTSLAINLVARSGTFLADDVTALEPEGEAVLAHPGAATASVDRREWRAVPREERQRLGEVVGRSEKLCVTTAVLERPLPLAGLYFLERTAGGGMQIVREIADARRLLSSAFISYLRSPHVLVRHLAACESIARLVPTFSIRVPPGVGARAVAVGVEEHVESLG